MYFFFLANFFFRSSTFFVCKKARLILMYCNFLLPRQRSENNIVPA